MRSRKYLAIASSLAISLSAAAQEQRSSGVQPVGLTFASSGGREAAVNAAVSATLGQVPQVPGVPAPGVPAPGVPGLPGAAPALPGAAPGLPAAGAIQPAGAVPGAVAPTALAPQRSIWGFLGLPPTFSAMGDSIHTKCAAAKAKMETTPLCQMVSSMAEPMLALVGLNHGPPPIGSEALMNATNPAIKDSAAVQEANAIKQQEDAAPAKIAAIKYLAGVDCKCYPGVKSALLQALKDCNEGVRFEAAKALGSACCCDREVAKILDEVANKQDEFGNYKEWSSRVRAAAAQSAAACSGVIPPETKLRDGEVPPAGEVPPVGDGEIPLRPQTKRGFFNRDKKVAAADTQPETTAGNNQKEAATLTRSDAAVRTSRDNRPQVQERTKVEASVAQRQEKVKPSSPAPLRQASATRDDMKSASTPQINSTPPTLAARGSATPAAAQKELANKSTTKPAVHIDSIESKDDADPGAELMGTVTYVDVKTGSVRLSFAEGDQPRAGARADVFHKYLLRMQHLGELEIIGSSDGVTLARPTGELTIKQLSKGDRVIIH